MDNDPAATLFPANALARWQDAATPITIAALLGEVDHLGVIVPHPDDEILGCGGLIAAAAAQGIAVTVTILTDGDAPHHGAASPLHSCAGHRRLNASAGLAILTDGRGDVVFAGAPTGALAEHPDAGDAVPAADLYVTCWQDDPHADHVAAYAIAAQVARRFGRPLLAFPFSVLTGDGALPAGVIHRIDVTPQLARKRAALTARGNRDAPAVAAVEAPVINTLVQRLFMRPDEIFAQVA